MTPRLTTDNGQLAGRTAGSRSVAP